MSFRLAATSALRTAARTAVRRSALQLTARAVVPTSARLFSTTFAVKNSYSQQVSESLKSELEHERANKEDFPEELTAFLESTGFEIIPSEGKALGKLVKRTPSETVYVFFDINQVANVRPSEVEEADEAEGFEEEDFENSFINLNIVVEKQDKSAVSFDVLVGPEDGSTYIDNVTAYADSTEALTESAEADQKREITYNGPAFSNLDEALQVNFENYLASRGVDNELYQFILNFGIYKENVEYLHWLEKLDKFFK